MVFPCGKFDDCSFSRSGSIVRTNIHRQTDASERFTPAISSASVMICVMQEHGTQGHCDLC